MAFRDVQAFEFAIVRDALDPLSRISFNVRDFRDRRGAKEEKVVKVAAGFTAFTGFRRHRLRKCRATRRLPALAPNAGVLPGATLLQLQRALSGDLEP
jgi:hypothetical protein